MEITMVTCFPPQGFSNWLWTDYESCSEVDIKKVGGDVYCKHPSTKILMFAYAFNDGPVKLWQPHLGMIPAELYEALCDDSVLKCAWNYNFERDITREKLGIETPQSVWYDPSVLSAYMSLPVGLDRAGKALEITGKKIHITGDNRPIALFSKPSKRTKTALKKDPTLSPTYFKNWDTHPTDWELFCTYCIQDVISEREIHYVLTDLACPMTSGEHDAWALDQRMNQNGVWIDQAYVANAKKMAIAEADAIIEEMRGHTGLENPNSRDQLLAWAKERGYPTNSMDVENIEETLKIKSLKPLLRTVLELKQKLGGSAYKKLQTIEDRISPDGRLRDQFVYHGAHTARWSGRGVQLQNLYKPDKAVSQFLDRYVRAIRNGKKIISKNSQMELVASTLRAAFAAPAGRKLVVGDLAQIESRVLAVLAGCATMSNAYQSGLDLYKDIMSFLLEKPYDQITSGERANGKVIILGCGYGMGWEKFIEYALTFGVVIDEKTAKKYVYAFREKYKEIPAYWRALEAACMKAVKLNICVYVNGVVVDGRDERILKLKLPSGRAIHYFNPRVSSGIKFGRQSEWITYTAFDKKGVQHKDLYGGLICENVVQAVARDLLLNGMIECEKEGFLVIMTIHDEIAAEADKDDEKLNVDKLLECMRRCPEWAEGMGFVLAAEGYEGPYYKK